MAKRPYTRRPVAPAAPGAPATDRLSNEALRERGLTPFIKASDIQDGDVLALSGFSRHTAGTFGEQIVMEVTLLRTEEIYDFAVKSGSPNHRKLHRALGADDKKWAGLLKVRPQPMARGGAFIEIAEIEAEAESF